MAGVARSLELQRAEASAVIAYKRRLIDYLDRFLSDLVRRSDSISQLIQDLAPRVDASFSKSRSGKRGTALQMARKIKPAKKCAVGKRG